MLLLMLEGSVNTYYGDELGLLDANETDIHHSIPNRVRQHILISLMDIITLFFFQKKFVMRSPMQWNNEKNAGFSSSDNILVPPNPDYTDNNLQVSFDPLMPLEFITWSKTG